VKLVDLHGFVWFHCDVVHALLLGGNKHSKLEVELQQGLAVAEGEICRLQQALEVRGKEADLLSLDKHKLEVKLRSIVAKPQSTINSFFTNQHGTRQMPAQEP
jgi:hypothetical protein